MEEECDVWIEHVYPEDGDSMFLWNVVRMYTLFNKNQVAWYFVHPAQAVT